MLAAERAVVFFQAAWSVYAMRSRRIIEDLEQKTAANAWTLGVDLTWWEIDATEQFGIVWEAAYQWLEPQCENADTLIWGGWGAVVWCSRGRVLDSAVSAEQVLSVMDCTRAIFESRSG